MRQRARPRGRIIKSFDGPPCPGCGRATEVRKYERIGPKQLMRPLYYYSRWYCCMNKHCRTTLIMPEEFKVRNRDPPNGSELLS
jgi:hypothetical protein